MQQSWFGQDRSFKSIMLLAASLAAFLSFCKLGEITTENENKYDPSVHLSFSDMVVDDADSPNVISLNMKHLKTDQGQ